MVIIFRCSLETVLENLPLILLFSFFFVEFITDTTLYTLRLVGLGKTIALEIVLACLEEVLISRRIPFRTITKFRKDRIYTH